MKKTYVSVLALAAVMMMAPVSQAKADQTPGWYVGAGVGANFNPNEKVKTPAGTSTLNYDTGWDFNGNGGYAFDNGFRVEGEAWRSTASIDKVTPAAGPRNGEINNTDLFVNGLYDFHTGTMWTPYVGAGVGIAFVDADHIASLANGSALSAGTTELAYQAIGGIAAQLDTNWALTADYRYVATTDPKFKTTAGGKSYTGNESHNVVIGFRYSFGQPVATPVRATVAPRPMAAAAPKPAAVAPIAQSYMVFFDFNKSDLTPEAKRILASAAQDFQGGKFIRVVVTGHTDTVGSNAYNQALSQRRAAAVKAELTRLGVANSEVQAVGVGKNGLLVPTADGVREAQNRRAEIVFDKK